MEKSERKEAQIGDATFNKELVKNLCNFNRMPECCCTLPELNSTENHTVLFNTTIVAGIAPEVFPDTIDKWDDDHVWMPHSSHNIITVKEQDGKEKQMNGWEIITNALSRSITSVKELEDALSTYAKPYGYSGNLNRLAEVVEKEFNKSEREEFYSTTLPGIIKLALQLPSLCTQPIPLLKKDTQHMITISQKQIACLLANAFLSTFPKRSRLTYTSFKFSLSSLNLNLVSPSRDHRPVEKIKCILNYFRRVTTEEPTGTVTFQRKCLIKPPNWSLSNNNLCSLSMQEDGTIENEGSSMLQVDFADEYVGGLVLQTECAQEEVLFIVSSELIAAILFTEKLEANETLLVTGCERYNVYSGYEYTFKWEGDFCDKTPRDAWGRKYIQMIAMDALCVSGLNEYRPSIIERELNKAFCGFSEPNLKPQNLPAIASGKWGCGVFGGEPKLKSLIQLMAASEARRDLVLFTFHDHQLKQEVESLYSVLQNKEVTVGRLWKLLKKYYEEVVLKYKGKAIFPLYDFLYKELGSNEQ